jgi:uncharacterized damage-inducible protein DinB
MFRRVDGFLKIHEKLMLDTSRLFSVIQDKHLAQSVVQGQRTLGDIAWHIVATISWLMDETDLGHCSVDWRSEPPLNAKRIIEGYRAASSELAEALASRWKDSDLLQSQDLDGQLTQRGVTLMEFIHHELHHRGQITVLLRQAGVRVPGLFGPAKEEWEEMGRTQPPY